MIVQRINSDIRACFDEDKYIKKVLPFNSQYDNTEDDRPHAYPMLYVEVDKIDWHKDTNNYVDQTQQPQSAEIDIRLHLVYHSLADHDFNREKEINLLVDYVTYKVQRLGSGTDLTDGSYTSLIRTYEERRSYDNMLSVVILTFHTLAYEVYDIEKIITELRDFNIEGEYIDEK